MKKHNYSIFIACGTSMKEERTAIKAIVNDLNGEYQNRGIHIISKSYENFENNQKLYNQFIENEADLVIFILDSDIGPKTKDELILANRKRHENGKPSSLIFIKEYDNETLSTSFLKGLLSLSEQYTVPYRNKETLPLLCKPELRKILENYCIKISTYHHISHGIISKKFAAVLVLLSIFCTFIYGMYDLYTNNTVSSQPSLLLTGGGSAANFIDDITPGFKIRNYRKGYYVHMPSASAWLLMTEEVITPQDSNRRYYPICISASEAKEEDFLTTRTSKENFLKAGVILSVKIGYDTLAAYIKNVDTITETIKGYDSNIITAAELGKLTQRKDLNVFTTSHGSGTRRTYESALENEGFSLTNTLPIFSEDSDLTAINKKNIPYILLGSKYYFMKALAANNKVKRLYIKDRENKYILKTIFLYFMAYRIGKEDNIMEIPPQTLDFLELLSDGISRKGDSDNSEVSNISSFLEKKVKNGRVKIGCKDFILFNTEALEDW